MAPGTPLLSQGSAGTKDARNSKINDPLLSLMLHGGGNDASAPRQSHTKISKPPFSHHHSSSIVRNGPIDSTANKNSDKDMPLGDGQAHETAHGLSTTLRVAGGKLLHLKGTMDGRALQEHKSHRVGQEKVAKPPLVQVTTSFGVIEILDSPMNNSNGFSDETTDDHDTEMDRKLSAKKKKKTLKNQVFLTKENAGECFNHLDDDKDDDETVRFLDDAYDDAYFSNQEDEGNSNNEDDYEARDTNNKDDYEARDTPKQAVMTQAVMKPAPSHRPKGMCWDPVEGEWKPKASAQQVVSQGKPKMTTRFKGRRTNRVVGGWKAKDSVHVSQAHAKRESDRPKKRMKSSVSMKILNEDLRKETTTTGSRVYAEWKDTGDWYFGTVMAIKRQKVSSDSCYSIQFDDGDFLDNVLLKKFISICEYQRINGGRRSPSMPEEHRHMLEAKNLQTSKSPVANIPFRRCNECEHCSMKDCGICAACLGKVNVIGGGTCFQTICCKVSITTKRQPMPALSGFPDGWKFTIDPELPNRWNSKYAEAPVVKGLKYFCPSLKRSYYSFAAAYKATKRTADASPEPFYMYIGARPGLKKLLANNRTLCWNTSAEDVSIDAEGPKRQYRIRHEASNAAKKDTFLVGRPLCFEWINVDGQRKGLYGTVTECCSNTDDDDTDMPFTVVYNERSRTAANAITNGCGSTIPESENLSAELVIGACLAYEQKHAPHETVELLSQIYSSLPSHRKWLNPVSRHEEMVAGEDSRPVPRLTLIFRGYELVFDTKASTIPGAGYGIFLSCRPLFEVPEDKPLTFQLDNCELLDLGVYAPFRSEDKKPAAAFDVKNFIHGYNCEEFLFDSRELEFQLDITDDVTGKLHEDAWKHIPAFVNECRDDDKLCVLAERDAEDCVHYLLGHAKTSQGNYIVPADGSQVELFIDYGDAYEKVRVRKGFSSLSEQEKEPFEKGFENEDMDDFKNMNSFNALEVKAAVDFLVRLFSSSSDGICKLSSAVKQRSLICSAILQYRAQNLLLNKEVDEETSYGDLQKVLHKARGLCKLVLINSDKGVSDLRRIHANGNVEGLLSSILAHYYKGEQLDMINNLLA